MPCGFFKFLISVFATVQFLALSSAWAKEITVFDIRRPVSLENNQEMPKDFFINAGVESGLKVGMVITVNRRQTLYDPFQSKSPGDLVVPVGKLRVIHTQENISVARMVEIMGRESLPGLEFDAIMVGDRLDMATAKMGKNSDKAMYDSNPAPTLVVAVEEVQAAPAPVAPAPEALPATPSALANTTLPPRESSSQLPATTLPTQGPTL